MSNLYQVVLHCLAETCGFVLWKKFGGPSEVKNRTTLGSNNCITRYLPKE